MRKTFFTNIKPLPRGNGVITTNKRKQGTIVRRIIVTNKRNKRLMG